jgi:hypothetical protein
MGHNTSSYGVQSSAFPHRWRIALHGQRIGHANVGFFLETYPHVLGNDDREAAEQAASFLLGDAWEADPDETPI